jgi:quercetin dioxygenase-like cupin family protein
MKEQFTTPKSNTPVPPDDPDRKLVIARPNSDRNLSHVGLVGDTYTILLSGDDTAGRYCLIDMHIPSGGGPPPHRHDFEESFTILEGEIEAACRGEKFAARAGETIHIPANAPHSFANISRQPARLLCICSPAGQEEFFAQVGVPVLNRTAPPPKLDAAGQAAFMKKSLELAPKYQTELLKPE